MGVFTLIIVYWVGNEKIAELLADHNAVIDAKNVDEITPLHLAAENGN